MAKVSHDSEVLEIGQQVITACAFIHQKLNGVEKVFLPRRAATKKFLPSVYELPGGHIDFGEEIIEGLKREIKEEFGMSINVGDPFHVFTYKNEVKGSHSIEVVYFATFVDSVEKITLNPEDHSEYQWFTKDEVLSNVVDSNKKGEDSEIHGILRGFSLLSGDSIYLGII